MRRFEVDPAVLLEWQQQQFAHDQRNHTDIISLSRVDRLKHYGLHYAKYAGRVAREGKNNAVILKTAVDAALVCLSAANALSQRLDKAFNPNPYSIQYRFGLLGDLADAGGRFSDACEKIDHLEDFLPLALDANVNVLEWCLRVADNLDVDLQEEIGKRRKQLAERQFLIPQTAK